LISIPNAWRSTTVAADKLMSLGLLKYCAVSHPPIIEPSKKRRFQRSARQLKSKNLTRFPAPAREQMVCRLEEKPNLFPQKMSISITAVISKPEIYQGQGC